MSKHKKVSIRNLTMPKEPPSVIGGPARSSSSILAKAGDATSLRQDRKRQKKVITGEKA